jgi:guanylate kinase
MSATCSAGPIGVFIISAPSGSGKSTLVHRLLERHEELIFSISCTTRPPRGQETNGVEYNFLSRKEFEAMIRAGEFLEYAEVFGNYYGTHRADSLDRSLREGKDLVLDIDVQGARQLKVALPDAVSIFILPPSREILEARLRARSQDTEEVIQRRLRGAAAEVANYRQYDYVLINREIEQSVSKLECIVMAEKLRRTRMDEEVRPILEGFEK